MSSNEEEQVLFREVPILEVKDDGDGRTLEARIIPYGESATICDPPDFITEQERFAPGAFERQINAAHRVKVWLSTLHEQGLRGIVGHGEKLEDREDGLYATFRVHDNEDGNKALHLVRDGLLPALSIEFLDLKSVRRNGTVERIRGHLKAVSLVPVGAYKGAEVLALRAAALEAQNAEPEPESEPESESVEIAELPRLRALPQTLAYELAARGFKLEEEEPADE